MGPICDLLDAKPFGKRVVERVAGIRYSVLYVDHAVTHIARKIAAVEGAPARAVHMHVFRDPVLQTGQRHDDLESRAWGKLRLNRLIQQRMASIGDELVPLIAGTPHRKVIRIET